MYTLNQLQNEAFEKFKTKEILIAALPTGTGKTLLGCHVIQDLKQRSNRKIKVLLATPANLIHNFPDTIKQFNINIDYIVIQTDNDISEDVTLYIISYDKLITKYGKLLQKHSKFDLIICDELHFARNEDTKRFIILNNLRKTTNRFLGLTASYVSNYPKELGAILTIATGNPEYIKRIEEYVTYYDPYQHSFLEKIIYGFKSEWKISNKEFFNNHVKPYIYVPNINKVSNVVKLPKEIEKVYDVQISKKEWEVYKYVMEKSDLNDNLIKKFLTSTKYRVVKNKLLSLMQCLLVPDYQLADFEKKDVSEYTIGSKIKFVGEILTKEKKPTLVFTPFLKVGAKATAHYLNTIGIHSEAYSGELSIREKNELVQRFNNGELDCLCLTKAGEVGINLPRANRVIFLSLFWNPETIKQMKGRALRITSTHDNVEIIFLLAKYMFNRTIDHYMFDIVYKKQSLRQALDDVLSENQML